MKTKILLIEDNHNLSENVEEVLAIHGYELIAILTEAESAIQVIKEKEPDLILLDIKLKGDKDGIELSGEIRKFTSIPIVFLTSSAGKDIIIKVEHIKPDGFITKPFTMEGLITSIELALSNSKIATNQEVMKSDQSVIVKPELYIRENGWLRKIVVDEIEWIKAEGTYTQIHVNNKQYTLRNTVKELIKKLPEGQFARIHKSYIVNLKNVDAVNATTIKINDKEIPVGKQYYQDFLKNINKISN
ncbi:DNA-binding LytR/AlgR family response regulator [Algoriphagus sp. 4150]|uniref:LytR/AlgR family response regulator transcription factor n=1 Tax=Algoriphagus sp. 4150 TaxID=2817756 RepID=UPI0028626E9E|nr:response regulator transcription factor [Algoriphagus sp. 4150]MDR7132629.1 DNA-binding LytR/AlgR family response regulator [Algoriphagus sp. 4150]